MSDPEGCIGVPQGAVGGGGQSSLTTQRDQERGVGGALARWGMVQVVSRETGQT